MSKIQTFCYNFTFIVWFKRLFLGVVDLFPFGRIAVGAYEFNKIVWKDSNPAVYFALPPARLLSVLADDGDHLTHLKSQFIVVHRCVRKRHLAQLRS